MGGAQGRPAKTALDLDREFDEGSRLAFNQLTTTQIENLTWLGKVWGFLKYHHPSVTKGRVHWDYELLRVLPKVLAAADRASSNDVMRDWVRGIGEVPACSPCLMLQGDNLHIKPRVDWIRQEAVLGRDLPELLQAAYRARSGGTQFYVSPAAAVGNPVFAHELTYGRMCVLRGDLESLPISRQVFTYPSEGPSDRTVRVGR